MRTKLFFTNVGLKCYISFTSRNTKLNVHFYDCFVGVCCILSLTKDYTAIRVIELWRLLALFAVPDAFKVVFARGFSTSLTLVIFTGMTLKN